MTHPNDKKALSEVYDEVCRSVGSSFVAWAAIPAEVLRRQAKTHVPVPIEDVQAIAAWRRAGGFCDSHDSHGASGWAEMAIDRIVAVLPDPDPLDEIVEQTVDQWAMPKHQQVARTVILELAEDEATLRALLARHEDGTR